jgi:uncharacterized sporulation protein YeaH/YhbH (DUF444 family)
LNIVDRRLNPRGKSLANRQRFIRRARKQILEAVREASAKHGIADAGGDRIKISADSLREPSLHPSHRSGQRTYVVPGNKEYVEGDRIPRPPGGGEGQGSEGAADGETQDAFQFVLSQEEFLDLFLEDLELPDLLRKQLRHTEGFTPQRAGYRTTGSAANLNLLRTMRNSLSRRIALKRPRASELLEREHEIESLDPEGEDAERRRALQSELDHQRLRSRRIPFIDPVDVRYNRFENIPRPAASAVMFCLMDVSGSMTAHMKDLAKRFYKLLYLFLSRRYRHVEIVFIRHTHMAREVDEETFFSSTESGGTIVSTAFEEMLRVLSNRYPRDQWNVYAAQASDGDNMPADNPHAVSLLQNLILPCCQYFAYLEVGSEDGRHGGPTELWRAYQRMAQSGQPIAMRKVNHRSQIYPVFRQLFARDRATRQDSGAGA